MKNIIAIETKNTHYVLGVDKSGVLHCVHWGKKANFADYEVVEKQEINSNHSVLDCTQTEYTVFGGTMYRGCAFKCTYGDGCRDSVFKYKSHIQRDGSLDVTLTDPAYNVEIVLSYKYSRDSDVITKYITVINNSGADIKIERIMSGELCLPGCEPYDVTNTNGSWGGEFQLETAPLKAGTAVFESRKGTAGHTNSPFVVLSQNATEDCGRVYFAALGYGGNFKIEASRDFIGKTRVIAGLANDIINPLIYGGSIKQNLVMSLIGIAVSFLIFYIPKLVGLYMGNGDVKLSAVFGFALGFVGYIQAMVVMAVISVLLLLVLIITKKGNGKTKTPMGPALSIGAVLTVLLPLLSNVIGDAPFSVL